MILLLRAGREGKQLLEMLLHKLQYNLGLAIIARSSLPMNCFSTWYVPFQPYPFYNQTLTHYPIPRSPSSARPVLPFGSLLCCSLIFPLQKSIRNLCLGKRNSCECLDLNVCSQGTNGTYWCSLLCLLRASLTIRTLKIR